MVGAHERAPSGAPQGSQGWLDDRSGYATASCFSDILAQSKTKGQESASRRNYRIKLVTERLIKQAVPETFRNAAMDWGNQTEYFARTAVEMLGYIVFKSPFVCHATIPWVGCSPDGLIEPDGLVEIKSPYVSTHHIETWDSGMPRGHIAQVQGEMWVTGRQWVLFVSFDPRMPEHLQIYTQVIKRDEKYIADLEVAVVKFLSEVEGVYERLASTKFGK